VYPDDPVPERQNQSGFTGARDSEWQWHQMGHMQISIPPLSILQAECPSYHPTNSVKSLLTCVWLKNNLKLKTEN